MNLYFSAFQVLEYYAKVLRFKINITFQRIEKYWYPGVHIHFENGAQFWRFQVYPYLF